MYKQLQRLAKWEEEIYKLKLFQRQRLENITRQDFIHLFPIICSCAIRILRVRRTYHNHFNVDVSKDYIRYRSSQLRLFLVQMGDEPVKQKRSLYSFTILGENPPITE